jgi:hypothetical protein
VDFFPKASNGGFVDSADVQTYLTANGGGFAYTRQVYDLTGGGAGVGNTLLDTTNPRYNLSGVSASVGTVDFVSSNVQRLSNNSSPLTRAQPFTIAAVAKHTTTNSGTLYSNGAWAMQYKDTAVNQVSIYAGAAKIHATANDGTFNSVIIVVNGSSSKVVVNDGTPANSTAIGTAGSTSGDILNVGQFGSSLDFFDGSFCEFAIIAGAASAGTITALYQNQRTAYGNIF